MVRLGEGLESRSEADRRGFVLAYLFRESNPSSYYQPIAKLMLPLAKNINWFTEWRYYGYGEAFYIYEGFHAQPVTTGLRFTR